MGTDRSFGVTKSVACPQISRFCLSPVLPLAARVSMLRRTQERSPGRLQWPIFCYLFTRTVQFTGKILHFGQAVFDG